MVVKRITLFNFSDDDIPAVKDAYARLQRDNKKDGKPYLLAQHLVQLHDDPRSSGFRLAAHSDFASLADMRYYDDGCEAHAALKALLAPRARGTPVTVYWEA